MSRTVLALVCLLAGAQTVTASGTGPQRLPGAYPGLIERIDGDVLVWRDGTRMAIGEGRPDKPFAAWLAAPDIADMFRHPYPAGSPATPPPREFDPGRARNSRFFRHMYGDCRKGEVEPKLVEIIWLPRKAGQRLRVTRVNDVAARLTAISLELDRLPDRFDTYLKPSAGTFNCRTIAGTDQASAHGYGIAIDIAVAKADYWRWSAPGADGAPRFRNAIPMEIVEVFERHGFIWGGRWHHFDTMHFEYRPELLPPSPTAPPR